MKRHLPITGKLGCILIAIAFVWGCGDQKETARKPQVVRKKIVVAAKAPSQARSKPSRPAAGKASAPRPKSDIASAKPPRSGKGQTSVSTGKGAAVSRKDLRPKSDIARQPAPVKSAGAVAQPSEPQKAPVGDTASLPASGSSDTRTSLRPRSESAEDSPKMTLAAAEKNAVEKQQTTIEKPSAGKKSDAGKTGSPEIYDPTGKTDPFVPLFQEKPVLPQKKTRRRIPRTPLERIALSQLKLTAIILAPSGNRALVQEASGKGYVIRDGTYIGLDGGKVVEIERGRVIIEEEIEDIVGKLTKRKQELKLAKPVGEK